MAERCKHLLEEHEVMTSMPSTKNNSNKKNKMLGFPNCPVLKYSMDLSSPQLYSVIPLIFFYVQFPPLLSLPPWGPVLSTICTLSSLIQLCHMPPLILHCPCRWRLSQLTSSFLSLKRWCLLALWVWA